MSNFIPQEQWFKSIPKKFIASSTLLFNFQGKMLILRTTYKEGWWLPGGVCEEGESPSAAAIRETAEEVGVQLKKVKFLGIEFKPTVGYKLNCLQFMFYGGRIHERDIKLQSKEIAEYKFVSPTYAVKLMSKNISERTRYALQSLKTGKTFYYESTGT
ncbi:MAG TPA: NUDIX hydrolase [Patescibacteria group bacterium]|nr:NUDIX hydrolase [Patescibacteria group bacterium]